jgi:hypothetical protein
MKQTFTPSEILALFLEDIGKACLARAEQLLRATADPEAHLDATERWLTAQEVAKILKTSPGYVYANAERYPFTRREGRLVRFSAQGLEAYQRQNGLPDARP